MKKILSIIASIVILCMALSVSATSSDISVYVDNELTELTDANGNAVYPFIQNGTTYVPLRGVSEALDCDVVWDGNNNTILIYKEMQSDNSVFRNNSDEVKLYVDNMLTELKDANGTVVKPFIKDGTTYVPLRGVSQALGCWVRWDGQTKTVSVYMNTCPPDGVTLSENKPYDVWQLASFYDIDGEQLEIDDSYYTNSLRTAYGPREGYALFNLNGKYNKMTFVLGATDGESEEITATIIVDGKIIDKIIVDENKHAEEVDLELNYGLQMKIILEGWNAGMGNITFWDE